MSKNNQHFVIRILLRPMKFFRSMYRRVSAPHLLPYVRYLTKVNEAATEKLLLFAYSKEIAILTKS